MKKTILTIIMLVAMSLSAAAAYVVVTGTNVRLRLKPSLKSETLTNSHGENVHPAKGEKLELLGDAGDFYKVRYKGQVVYISKQFTQASETTKSAKAAPAASGQRYVVVTGTGVRLRLQPSMKAETLQRGGVNVHPKKGERIKLMGDAGDFYKVNYQGNYVYIHKDYAKSE
ncbi:MAG: hypothetical protein IJT30_07065 [Muribaculaceae bacterium]|nr:hypothetical protein [Muribaculaceae bacterium]